MKIPNIKIPIVELPLHPNIKVFIKREDQIHPEISGNKFWKLFYNVNNYLEKKSKNPLIIAFGGAFSNHIAAVSALGKEFGIETLGIIRGDEIEEKWQKNPTLKYASEKGMHYRFVSRERYKKKEKLFYELSKEFPEALILPEGGTNEAAAEGIQYMLGNNTKTFDYLCTAVGTGGTVAGISKFAEEHQKIIGINMVLDDSLNNKIFEISRKRNFKLISSQESYGKITDETVRFINDFFENFGIPLDPIYTSKMMKKMIELINNGFFPENSKILMFHTGGLQGILGANEMLKKQNREQINFKI